MNRLIVSLTLCLSLAACTSEVEGGASCCDSALDLISQMDDCCKQGISIAGSMTGCCTTGMLAETPDEERPDCCVRGKALLDQASSCCQETILTGEAGGCCADMPAALAELGG